MLIANRAKYYLKRVRAAAKEIEFDVPLNFRAKKDIEIEELFPLAIASIADLSAGIVRGDIKVEQIKDFSKELQFASKFYDSYLHIGESINQDENYFYLVGAIAYYLCDQIGSSLVLAQKIKISTLTLSENKLDQIICAMLQNKETINVSANKNLLIDKYVKQFQHQYIWA